MLSKTALLMTSLLLTGCAAGSLVSVGSAYSLNSKTADGLSAEAEQRVVDRVKEEIRK